MCLKCYPDLSIKQNKKNVLCWCLKVYSLKIRIKNYVVPRMMMMMIVMIVIMTRATVVIMMLEMVPLYVVLMVLCILLIWCYWYLVCGVEEEVYGTRSLVCTHNLTWPSTNAKDSVTSQVLLMTSNMCLVTYYDLLVTLTGLDKRYLLPTSLHLPFAVGWLS